MSALAELQQRIEGTNALIAQYERAISFEEQPRSSLFANIRALEKLRRRLEEEFLGVARRQGLEIYRYRILSDTERPGLASIAHAWAGFQDLFAAVYQGLTKTEKKKPGRKPVERLDVPDLGYAYSFAGSVGVVVTVQGEKGLFADSPLERTSEIVFDLIEKRNLADVARSLGPAPIEALHAWVDSHVKNRYGIGLEWHADGIIRRTAEVQLQELKDLQSGIINTTTESVLQVTGELVAVNCETSSFKINADDGQEIEGTFAKDAISPEHAASVPSRYQATIAKITKIVVLGKESKTSFVLRILQPL